MYSFQPISNQIEFLNIFLECLSINVLTDLTLYEFQESFLYITRTHTNFSVTVLLVRFLLYSPVFLSCLV